MVRHNNLNLDLYKTKHKQKGIALSKLKIERKLTKIQCAYVVCTLYFIFLVYKLCLKTKEAIVKRFFGAFEINFFRYQILSLYHIHIMDIYFAHLALKQREIMQIIIREYILKQKEDDEIQYNNFILFAFKNFKFFFSQEEEYINDKGLLK